MSEPFKDLNVEQFKFGIFNFVMEWVKHNNQVAGLQPETSHIEPVAWLRELCDSLDEQQSNNTKDNITT